MRSLTQKLCGFGSSFSLSCACEQEQHKAKLLLLDLIGVALGGLETEESQLAFRACRALDPGQEGISSLWGTGVRATAGTAALFNGTTSHALELDDFLGIDHTGAVVIPALLAVADQEPQLEGTEFLEGLIFGYEVGKRLIDAAGGYRQHNAKGWHTTGTLGPYAAAAAVGKFLKLSSSQLTSALGLAGSFTGGTWSFIADGAMSKRYHCGIAAQVGLQACYLAREGFTGPAFVLEAEWGGYFNLYADGITTEVATLADDLGSDLRVNLAGIKPYACCRGIHSAIEVILDYKTSHGLDPEELENVLVLCTKVQKTQLGGTNPTSRIEAQLSLPYSVAVAIKHGEPEYGYFTEKHIHDQDLQRLAGKIILEAQEGRPPEEEPEITIRKKDGSQFRRQQPHPLGDPLNPVSDLDIRRKFAQLSGRRLSKERSEHLESLILNLEEKGNLDRVRVILSERLWTAPQPAA